jgi:phosphoribosyl 1,2-cyclic phosphodiesterase
MSIKFCPLASGSNGNSIYIGTENTNILIDAGESGKKIIACMNAVKLDGNKLDALFVTHEHSDHIKGIGILSRKFDIPIYATERTWAIMDKKGSIGTVSKQNRKEVYKEEKIIINDLIIKPFSIPHDAVDAIAYTIKTQSYKLAVATDLGHASDVVKRNLLNSDVLLIDCNHDVEMLENGVYPRSLKNRVSGNYGHLSNVDTANLILSIKNSRLKHVFLAHISGENNMPLIALDTVSNILTNNNVKVGTDIKLHVTNRTGISDILDIA